MYRLINTRSPFYLQFTSAGNEPEATNLVPFNEEFGVWDKTNISVSDDVSTYAGQPLLAPDGTQTADLAIRTSTADSYVSKTVNKTFASAENYALSIFVKRGTSRYVSLRAQGLYPDRLDMQYDFETMQFSEVGNYGTDISLVSTQVEQYNGWTRIGFVVLTDDHTQIKISISPKEDANEGVDSGDSSSDANVFLWGAQIERGSSVTSYIKNDGNVNTTRAASTSFNEQEVSLDLSIYTGAFTNSPTSTYTLSKMPTNGLTTFEFSELVRDYIEQNSNTADGSVWVRATMSDGVQFEREYDFLATEGYNTRVDGVQTVDNADFQAKLMQTNTDVMIPEGMTLNIPVYANQNASYNIDSAASNTRFETPSTNGDYIQYFSVSSSDSVVEIKDFGVTMSTINVSVAECSKYPVNMLTFVNKLGAKQELYFEMKSTEKVSAKSDDFRRNTLDFSDLTANSLKHTTKKRIGQTIESFVLNTGFLTENNAQAIEELLVSEYVWLTQADSTVIPVNITDNSVMRKTHLNDKLIQYTINVEASAPYLNNYR